MHMNSYNENESNVIVICKLWYKKNPQVKWLINDQKMLNIKQNIFIYFNYFLAFNFCPSKILKYY